MVGSTATWRGGLYPSFCISRRHKNLYHRQPPSIHHYTGSGTVRHGTPHHSTAQHTTPHHITPRYATPFRFAPELRVPSPRPTNAFTTQPSTFSPAPLATCSPPSPPGPLSPFPIPLSIARALRRSRSLVVHRESTPTGASRSPPSPPASLDGWIDGWMDGVEPWAWGRVERGCKYRIYCMTGPRIPS